jgi:hypothetical protein
MIRLSKRGRTPFLLGRSPKKGYDPFFYLELVVWAAFGDTHTG